VLPIELLHGICFACGWGAGTITCKRMAPPELAATMQGIFQGKWRLMAAFERHVQRHCMLLILRCADTLGALALPPAPTPAGLYFGVGQGLGAIVGGALKQRYGGQAMFLMSSCAVAASWAALFAAELAAQRSWLQRLWRVLARRSAPAPAAVVSGRHWKHTALRSKDSGPDLAAVAMAATSSRLDC
jgi:hypothetical protein